MFEEAIKESVINYSKNDYSWALLDEEKDRIAKFNVGISASHKAGHEEGHAEGLAKGRN